MKTCPCNIQKFLSEKNENFIGKILIVLIFLPRTYIVGTNEYPQCVFWIKSKKIRYTLANPSFFYIKVGFKGVYISRTWFPYVLIF